MATSKTGSFWLTERLELAAVGTLYQGTIDLAAYVDVGDQQAISIEHVDFSVMRNDTVTNVVSYNLQAAVTSNATVSMQLSDLNPGTAFNLDDDNSLVAAGAVHFDDTANVITIGPNLFPDNFGKLDESRMVVNDSLYFVGTANTAYAADKDLIIFVRIKARIVKLSTKDWMAIAIQSTASDN